MNQNSQLELSLGEFEGVVRALLENPTLENALNANLGSLKLIEEFYEREYVGGVSSQEIMTYTHLVRLCLREFQEMIPRLNGQAWHVDLYSEHMRGRINLINRMYPSKING